MTRKKDFKELVRKRIAKTGESYVEARRQLLAKRKGLCTTCGGKLATRTLWEFAEPDEDATDGQWADHNAAILSDDPGEWGVEAGEEEYCPTCEGAEADRRIDEADAARLKARVESASRMKSPKVDELVKWFFSHYEDPANGVLHDRREGGYQYLLGGPENANDVLREYFEDRVPEHVILEAADVIERDGWEWVEINQY